MARFDAEFLPLDVYDLDVRVRHLDGDAVAVHAEAVETIDTDFLGPVFAGMEVMLSWPYDAVFGDAVFDDAVMAALARTAWACSGPVICLDDGAVRQSIDFVSFATERLFEACCFGENILLRLPHCERYEAHVRTAVQAMLADAGVNVLYQYSTGRKDHVKLCFDNFPNNYRATLSSIWQALIGKSKAPPLAKTILRGHELRVVAYVKELATDKAFWCGSE